MTEFVKFNCHVMAKNVHPANITPEKLLAQYLAKRKNGIDYIFDGVDCVVVSCAWASGRSSIISKILRKGDLDNEIVCTE